MKPRLRDILQKTLSDEITKAQQVASRKWTALTHLICEPDLAVFSVKARVLGGKGKRKEIAWHQTTTHREIVDAMRAATDGIKESFDRKKHVIVYEVSCVVGNNVHVSVPREFWKQHEYAGSVG